MHQHKAYTFDLTADEHPNVTPHNDGCVSFHYSDWGSRTVETTPGHWESQRVDGRGFAIRLLPQHIPNVKALLAALEAIQVPNVPEQMPESW